jgi:hypothetical protein
MTIANDSVAITPGSGATIATHLVSSKEYQVVMLAQPNGQLVGELDSFVASTGNTAHVAAARTTLMDLFNATGSGAIIRVRGLYLIPTLAAVTGVGLTYEAIRTSAVGTGGTTVTPRPFDTGDAALSANVTARLKPTGGATTSATLLFINGTSEETIPYASSASVTNHIPLGGTPYFKPITLREGEGLKVDQTTSSAVGSVNVVMAFTVE